MVLANIILSTWHYILTWMVLCIPDSWLQNEFPICDQQLNIYIVLYWYVCCVVMLLYACVVVSTCLFSNVLYICLCINSSQCVLWVILSSDGCRKWYGTHDITHIVFEPLIKIMFLSYWLYCISTQVHGDFLNHLCFLTFCSLRFNQISDEGAHALAAALQVNQSLQELKWVQPFMSYFFSFPLVGR